MKRSEYLTGVSESGSPTRWENELAIQGLPSAFCSEASPSGVRITAQAEPLTPPFGSMNR